MTDLSRRAFLRNTVKLSAGLALAFTFGEGLRAEIERRGGGRTALLYASRYGSTHDTARWIAEGIDRDLALIDIDQQDPVKAIREHDILLIGSGVWVGGVHSGIKSLVKQHAEALQGKLMAVFVVCGTEPVNDSARSRISGYQQQIIGPLKQPPPFKAQFGGRVVVEQLNDEDKAALTRFYNNFLNRELVSWDRTSPDKAKAFGESLHTGLKQRMGA